MCATLYCWHGILSYLPVPLNAACTCSGLLQGAGQGLVADLPTIRPSTFAYGLRSKGLQGMRRTTIRETHLILPLVQAGNASCIHILAWRKSLGEYTFGPKHPYLTFGFTARLWEIEMFFGQYWERFVGVTVRLACWFNATEAHELKFSDDSPEILPTQTSFTFRDQLMKGTQRHEDLHVR